MVILLASEQQARAEAEQAKAANSMFLPSMSPALRPPLNAILGFTGTLLMKLPGPLTFDQEKQLTIVQRSGKHLLAYTITRAGHDQRLAHQF